MARTTPAASLKPAPPVYGPETAAAEMVGLVERPRRQVMVGTIAELAKLGPVLHLWALYSDYFRMVRRELPDRVESLRCYRSLIRWLGVDWNAVRLLVELVALIDPRVFDLARSVKQGLLGRPETQGSAGAPPAPRSAEGAGKHEVRA